MDHQAWNSPLPPCPIGHENLPSRVSPASPSVSRVVPSCLKKSALQARSRPRSGFLPFPVAIPTTSLSMPAKRFSCFSMPSFPLSHPFKPAKRHPIHSCRFPSALLPCPSRPPCSLCALCALCGSPKIFSNHWKIRQIFSNHWKNIFQSLENRPFADELPDCANPKRMVSTVDFIHLKC